jgi:hypothetical protein
MDVRRAFGFPFRGLVVTALAGGLTLAPPSSATAASRPASASARTGIETSESLPPARAGVPYLTYVPGAQSRPGYWSALAGTLPPGLAFNGHSGALSGLPGGTVTAAGSINGLGSVCVYAAPIVQQYQQISSAVSAPSGAYTIAGLASGGYLVEFAPCSATLDRLGAWWKGQSTASGASVVEVMAGKETTGISAPLAEGGAISGTVTSAVTGKPVAGICAATESASPSSEATDLFTPLPSETNSDGNYLIDGLAPGGYLVEFGPCSGVNSANYLLPTLWTGTGALVDTPPVVVSAGSTTTGISIALHEGGTFSGTITSSSGRPLGGVCVLAESNSVGLAAEGITAANGDYSVTGLPNGSYAALFEPCAGQNYAATVWKNGETFTVSAGKVTTGVSGALATGAEIEGALVSSSGVALSALCVVLSEQSPNETITIEEGPLGFAGSFSLPGLSAGKYSVGFSGSCIGQNYATTMWDAGKSFELKGGQIVSVALTLPPGGSITGSVTTAGGAPLSWFCVLATGGTPPAFIFAATVGLGGYYDLTGLSSGSYTVQIEPCAEQNLLGTVYDKGSPVAVKEGKTTSGISADFTNRRNDLRHRHVCDRPGAQLLVCDADRRSLWVRELNDLFGTYSAYGLPAGTYKVEFSSCGAGKFATQWWKDAATRADATPVVIGAGATVSGIDAVMQS